jgi:hypothetical protein
MKCRTLRCTGFVDSIIAIIYVYFRWDSTLCHENRVLGILSRWRVDNIQINSRTLRMPNEKGKWMEMVQNCAKWWVLTITGAESRTRMFIVWINFLLCFFYNSVQVTDTEGTETSSQIGSNWSLIGRLLDRISFITFSVIYCVLFIAYYSYYLWTVLYKFRHKHTVTSISHVTMRSCLLRRSCTSPPAGINTETQLLYFFSNYLTTPFQLYCLIAMKRNIRVPEIFRNVYGSGS